VDAGIALEGASEVQVHGRVPAQVLVQEQRAHGCTLRDKQHPLLA
jgi:hypothetical protein